MNTTADQIVDGVDLAGKTCVITGATSGLGRESARALAAAGAFVVVTGRDAGALEQTEAAIRAAVPGAGVCPVLLDLAALSSIRAAAAVIAERAPPIHVLMNNAGVMFTPFGRTDDGCELQFGTNHLGHFELTRLLIPQLEAAGGARVVNLSSEGHRLDDIDLGDPNWERRDYDKFRAYGASKTANVLHAVELDRRLRERGVRAYAVHPGLVATNLARHMSRDDVTAVLTITETVSKASGGAVLTPAQGAATQVWAAVSPDLTDVGGVYLADCAVDSTVAPYAVDADRARQLWDVSASICNDSRSKGE
jgi:NAD(P)-dependent dehydrogenase (short-subunit alcohol dehydrogenase family)